MLSRISIVAAFAAVSIAASAAYGQNGPNFQNQGGGQTLELAPHLAPQQQSQPPPQSDDNTRVIPVIPPSQHVLILPQASRDFIGKWGGHLQRTHKFGQADFPNDTLASLVFGEQDGRVVVATDVLGNRDTNVLQSTAQSEGPRAVTLTVQSVNIDTQPPLRQINKLSVRLTADNQLEGTQLIDFYVTGISEPIAEVEFEGNLKPLTRRDDAAMQEEILRSGRVPLWHVEQGNPPPEN
jgi:hypothetical protein